MRLRHTARAMGREVLRRLGLRRPGVEDRTHQHGVLDIAISHVDMARVVPLSSHAATVTLYTPGGDYRLTVRSKKRLRFELETPYARPQGLKDRHMPEEKEPEIIDLATMKDIPVLKTAERLLSVPLTEEEISEFGDAMASGALAIDEIEGIEKARASKWRAEHKVREATQLRIVNIYAAKAEDRQVEVITYAILDGPPDGNVAVTVRMDTGEVRNRRALTANELDKLAQHSLPLPPNSEVKDDAPTPAPRPTPKGARDLVAFIKAGCADDRLGALDADSRSTVEKAVAARREVLKASELPPEAGESKPAKSL